MRVVSLLPSATEIVCALGTGGMLVGVSHECDYPPEVVGLPVLTRPRYGVPQAADAQAYTEALAADAQSHSAAIDATIQAIRLDALSPYLLDRELLAELQPDVVLTQDLCEVCAPSLEEVRAAVRVLCGPATQVVSLTPRTLRDIWQNVHTIGEALGVFDRAHTLTDGFQQRLAAVQQRSGATGWPRRHVLTVEWFDPVMSSGLWIPELSETAGGIEVLHTTPGEKSRVVPQDELTQLDPEVIVLKPCGYKLADGLRELPALVRNTPWSQWRAVQNGEAYLMDGSAYFNRPGPRIAESCELLAAALHPDLFREIRERHRHEVLRIGPALEAEPW